MAYQGKPAYQQIADDIRQRILDGALRAGDRLPTEVDLMAEYGVSRIVVRGAVELLSNEGLVKKEQGRGTFVRDQRPPERRISGDLYGKRPVASPMKRATEAEGRRSEWDHTTRTTTATQAIAERLGIEPEDQVVRTTYTYLADETPMMLSTSYEPLALTGGTPIEHPESGPITGVVPRMDSIGLHITHVTEDVTARAPRPYEGEALRMAPGVPVIEIVRTYYVEDRAVETCDIVIAADRYALSYTIPIPPYEEPQA
ncbi:GntR family transcriptional regulator [Streptomyces sp. NBC_00335]|uniref:GntR family transcriptional regulator n=1 Tax=unclassified Streptomyces TaxID=2593676 RepID=UPI00225A6887|nr:MULTISPECIES: GntR family transcriptional regulator [unclassified Streptomyces]MCX5407482.1 GntR family transcriptional regulator [Streptomyces sp. NBC_00086]